MSRLLVRIRIIDNPYTHFCEQNPSGLIRNDATKDYVSDLYVKEKASSHIRCFFENSTYIVRVERTFSQGTIRYLYWTAPYRMMLSIFIKYLFSDIGKLLIKSYRVHIMRTVRCYRFLLLISYGTCTWAPYRISIMKRFKTSKTKWKSVFVKLSKNRLFLSRCLRLSNAYPSPSCFSKIISKSVFSL